MPTVFKNKIYTISANNLSKKKKKKNKE